MGVDNTGGTKAPLVFYLLPKCPISQRNKTYIKKTSSHEHKVFCLIIQWKFLPSIKENNLSAWLANIPVEGSNKLRQVSDLNLLSNSCTNGTTKGSSSTHLCQHWGAWCQRSNGGGNATRHTNLSWYNKKLEKIKEKNSSLVDSYPTITFQPRAVTGKMPELSSSSLQTG